MFSFPKIPTIFIVLMIIATAYGFIRGSIDLYHVAVWLYHHISIDIK